MYTSSLTQIFLWLSWIFYLSHIFQAFWTPVFYFLLSILALIFTLKATISHRSQRAVFPKGCLQTIFIRVPCNVCLKYNLFFIPETHSQLKSIAQNLKILPVMFVLVKAQELLARDVWTPCKVSVQCSELFQHTSYMPDAVKKMISTKNLLIYLFCDIQKRLSAFWEITKYYNNRPMVFS